MKGWLWMLFHSETIALSISLYLSLARSKIFKPNENGQSKWHPILLPISTLNIYAGTWCTVMLQIKWKRKYPQLLGAFAILAHLLCVFFSFSVAFRWTDSGMKWNIAISSSYISTQIHILWYFVEAAASDAPFSWRTIINSLLLYLSYRDKDLSPTKSPTPSTNLGWMCMFIKPLIKELRRAMLLSTFGACNKWNKKNCR